MEDKDLMEGVLLLEKGVCDLYLHGTIVSHRPCRTEQIAGSQAQISGYAVTVPFDSPKAKASCFEKQDAFL